MNQAIREQIDDLLDQARKLSHQTLNTPKSEREYLLACGKYQQLLANARALKEQFLDPEQHSADRDTELPEEDATEEVRPVARPRAQPQPDRLARQRQRHVPRSI
jgi:hypothetical protein